MVVCTVLTKRLNCHISQLFWTAPLLALQNRGDGGLHLVQVGALWHHDQRIHHFLIATILVTAPVIVGAHWFSEVDDISMVFIDSLDSVQDLAAIQDYFPPGSVFPICAAAETKGPTGIFIEPYFEESQTHRPAG
jgi:hypothetical protein